MKPKIYKLLLISLLISSLYSTAQPFQPFILPGKHWNVMDTNLDGDILNKVNSEKVVWDTRQIEKGIYIYTLKAGNISKQGKLIVQ